MHRTIAGTLLLGLFPLAPAAQVTSTATAPYVNFEAGAVEQLTLSPDGRELYLLNTRDHRLEVFRVRHHPVHGVGVPSQAPPGAGAARGTAAGSVVRPARRAPRLVHQASIFTGLEPVAMALDPTDARRLFVANHLSDSVVVVDLDAHVVVAALDVGDEPTDLELAGGKLYVSTSRSSAVAAPFDMVDHALVVLDGAAPYTKLAVLDLQAHKPRALVGDGARIYAIPQNSGNHTTTLKDDTAQSLGIDQFTVDAFDTNFVVNEVLKRNFGFFQGVGWEVPQAGRVVFDWEYPEDVVQLDDRDVVAVDVATDTVLGAYSTGVGTTLLAMERNPVTGDLWVANTDANNRIRMEYNLTGVAVRNLVTVVDASPGGAVRSQIELAPPLTALAHSQPHAIEFAHSQGDDYAYVAALGTATVVALDAATGELVAEITTGELPGGLAADGPRGWLYVYSRGDKTLEIHDIRRNHREVGERTPVPYDPEPPLTAAGRRLLYEARVAKGAGSGQMACSSCHVFGDTDGLAWDLGSSQGGLAYPYPGTLGDPASGFDGLTLGGNFTPMQNPMKGPLTTQSLRGLKDGAPFHWRGDRRFVHNFKGAFVGLQGGTGISDGEMQSMATFLRSLVFPPNPMQSKDREYTGDEALGLQTFGMPPFPGVDYTTGAGGFSCASCHEADFEAETDYSGSHEFLDEELIFQVFNTGTLRGVYEKKYQELTGFGTHHDGVMDGAFGFLDAHFQGFEAFDLLSQTEKQWLHDLIDAWDSGLSPLVGGQLHLDPASAPSASGFLDLAEEQARPPKSWIDLVASGWRRIGGEPVRIALLHRLEEGSGTWKYLQDDGSFVDRATLLGWVTAGEAELTFTAVPPGLGARLSIDRDEDGLLEREERLVHGTDPNHPDSDRDGYDDAAELSLGGDPASFDESLPDGTAPGVVAHEVQDVFTTTATLAVTLDEPAVLTVTVTPNGGSPLVTTSGELRSSHQVLLTGLVAGKAHAYTVDAADKNGNVGQAAGSFGTAVPHVHIESMELVVLQTSPVILEARFRVVDGIGDPVEGVPVNARMAGEYGGPETWSQETDANGEVIRVLPAFVPSEPGTTTLGVDFLGSKNDSHPYFTGYGGGTSRFFYEQAANAVNYATAEVF